MHNRDTIHVGARTKMATYDSQLDLSLNSELILSYPYFCCRPCEVLSWAHFLN